MGTMVEVLDKDDVKYIVYDMLLASDYAMRDAITAFLLKRYGITLEQFDKIIKEALPEEFI